MTKNNDREHATQSTAASSPDNQQDITPTLPLEPDATSQSAPADPPAQAPAAPVSGSPAVTEPSFFQRTWVRVTGVAVAAVILLGAGTGIGAAVASGGSDHSRGSHETAFDDGTHGGGESGRHGDRGTSDGARGDRPDRGQRGSGGEDRRDGGGSPESPRPAPSGTPGGSVPEPTPAPEDTDS